MVDLPKLTRITLGDGSFIHQHSTRFESNIGITDKVIDLPLLTDIVLVGYCLNGDSCMMHRINQIEPYLYLNSLTLTSMSKFYQSLKDLPSLTSIRNANGYSFNYYGLKCTSYCIKWIRSESSNRVFQECSFQGI